MAKKKVKEELDQTPSPLQEAALASVKTEKGYLLELYQVLQDRHINSISDLENLIAKS